MRSLKQLFMPKTQSKTSSPAKYAAADPPTNKLPVGNTYFSLPDDMTLKEDVLLILKRFDTVFVVDDSGSMYGSPWTHAKEALASLAQAAAQYDTDGIEIHFLNSPISQSHLRSAQAVEAVFNSVKPQAATPLGWRMNSLLSSYLTRLERDPTVKPVNYIVITDGEPSDWDILVTAIVKAARKLDTQNASPSQVGIQFVQIGNSLLAAKCLRTLDDRLKERYHIRDMVDTTPSKDGKIDIVKVLLGAINRRVDVKGSTSVGV